MCRGTQAFPICLWEFGILNDSNPLPRWNMFTSDKGCRSTWNSRFNKEKRSGFFFHFFLSFMGPCIVNVFKRSQQDATLHSGIYYCKCSTCSRQFLRPSSGAQNCMHSIGYLSSFFCFLPLLWVSWNSLTVAVRSRKILTSTRCCAYSFELLMIGGGTGCNMYLGHI